MELHTIPKRLFTSHLPHGEHEFACHVVIPVADTTDLDGALLWWMIKDGGGIVSASGQRCLTDDEVATRMLNVIALLPQDWEDGVFSAEVQSHMQTWQGEWSIEPFQQSQQFNLPIEGQLLVIAGHRVGEAHRHATAACAQQFGWDFIPLGPTFNMLQGSSAPGINSKSFFGYGRPVRAPAPGTIVTVVADRPDNVVIGRMPDPQEFRTNFRWALGNYVVIDHGAGIWSCQAHLRADYVVAKEGDTVTAGHMLGTVGNSGNSSGPHLHLHFMDSPDPLHANPLPVRLEVEGDTYAPLSGEIVSS
jgi:hypothetical protein